jgi:metalloendopeptidase OMA1, mitochondrial
MKKLHPIVLFLFLSFSLTACPAPRQPIPPGVVPAGRPVTVSEEQYGRQVLNALNQEFEIDYNDPRLPRVNEIVDRLTTSAQGQRDAWHVYLLKAPNIKNAGATRGNHVFIWSGMLDITKSDDEIATVLAHEIAHVLAGHTDPDPNEEIKRMLIGVGAIAAGVAAAQATKNPMAARNVGNITTSLTGEIGKGFLLNPYSREKELEADSIGLFMMADAKYNPEAAVQFWTRAQNDPDFAPSIEFFSTHPPPHNRLEQLQQLLPAAMARYKGSPAAVVNYQSQQPQGSRNDSFDWSTPSNLRPNATEHNLWRVQSSRAVLFQSPSTKSRAVGEFSRGAVITVVGKRGDWLEVASPDHGYIRPENLVPVSR